MLQPERLNSVGDYGAVERPRTSTVLLPPAPQAGASASSATTACHRLADYKGDSLELRHRSPLRRGAFECLGTPISIGIRSLIQARSTASWAAAQEPKPAISLDLAARAVAPEALERFRSAYSAVAHSIAARFAA